MRQGKGKGNFIYIYMYMFLFSSSYTPQCLYVNVFTWAKCNSLIKKAIPVITNTFSTTRNIIV